MKTCLRLMLTLFLFQAVQMYMAAQACTGVINTFPVVQSFENPANTWDQWSSAPFLWEQNSGPTTTPFTGPVGASDGTQYMYVEATNQSGSGVLFTPCMDLTSLANPQISFDYHLYGADAFRLVIQVSTDGGNSWGALLFSVLGDQGPDWISETIDLSPYASATNFRLRIIGVVNGLNGNDEGDVAIDNIQIGEAPSCFEISVNYTPVSCNGSADGAADLLIYPANTQGLSILWSTGATNSSITNLAPGNYSVDVTDNNGCTKTKNFAITEPSPLSADLYILPEAESGLSNGAIYTIVSGGSPPYSYQWFNGSTGNYNFSLSAGYEELVLTDANGCEITLPTFVPVKESCSGVYGNWPYNLTFEGNLGRFKQAADDDRNLSKRSGSTPTANTGPSSAIQGANYRYLESSGSGGPFKTAAIVSKRCFDITNLSNPELYFQYHMYGADMGQLFVQTSINGGYSWRENIWEVSGDQGNAWQEAFIDLSDQVSSELVIRIVARSGSGQLSDIAIDDLHIRTAGSSFTADETIDTRSDNQLFAQESLDTDIISNYYPNPTYDLLNIDHSEDLITLNVLNLQGQVLVKLNPAGNTSTLDLSQLSMGTYLLQAIDNKGQMSIRKVVKIMN